MNKSSKGRNIFSFVNGILLIMLSITTLYPFVHVASVAFSTQYEASKPGLHLIPREIDATNFIKVLTAPEMGTAFLNTIHRTLFGTILALIVTGMAAYTLSKSQLPYRKFFMIFIVFTMYFTGGLIPNFLLIKMLGLYDNRWALILPLLSSGYNLIIMKNFFQSLPDEIEESALIDGANYYTIFFRLIVPLSKPVMATITLWVAVQHWNAYLDNLMFMSDSSKFVLQRIIRSLVIEANMDSFEMTMENSNIWPESLKASTILISTLPILILYPFIQKYFMKGIMMGAVKG